MSETRTATQYCPYCGDTNLWPHEASQSAWECRDCGRVFSVSFLGLSGRAVSGGPSGVGSSAGAPRADGSAQAGETS